MKLFKPVFWESNNIISILLIPFSLLVRLIIFIKKTFIKKLTFKIPIICIGNIYIGGTGKTPLSIFLAQELKNIGKKPTIVKKFYKEHQDEHELIKNNFNSLILNKKRSKAIDEAVQKNFDTVILDDGFQDYRIKKDISILCFNQNQLIGNGRVIPAGPLRENFSSIKNAQTIIINGEKNLRFERKILKENSKLSIFYIKYKPQNIEELRRKKIIAVAGIGNPINFFNLLSEYKFKIDKTLAFPDHYQFSKSEILDILNDAKRNDCQVLLTEKDYYKIQKYDLKEVKFLKVELEIDNKLNFMKKINTIYA